MGFKLITLVVIGTDCIGICKCKYHRSRLQRPHQGTCSNYHDGPFKLGNLKLIKKFGTKKKLYLHCRFTDLKQYSIDPDNISTILVGMRCHAKKREISKEKAEAYAEHIGIPYMEVSAEEGTNVKEVFDLLADNILQVYQRHPSMCIAPTVSLNLNKHDIKAKHFLCSC